MSNGQVLSERPLAAAPGTTIQVFYLDDEGREQRCLVQTTESRETVLGRAKLMRQAIEAYYATLGGELISAQLMLECPTHIEEADCGAPAVRASHLRLVASHGKRIISADARLLAESAGIDPAAVYGSGP
jgi:hypothetical protein